MKNLPLSILFLVCCTFSQAQSKADHNRLMVFPDIPGYKTMKCDFHMHTAFSDGSVWPDIRVQEALKDGLDAISMTEHLEYQPHKADIPHPDRNRAHDVAVAAAKGEELMIVRGSEITRSMPPGHSNAIFIEDANKLLIDDPVAVFREANNQGAFVFWNHPNWTAQNKDGIAKLTDMHKQLIKDGLLHGIEVVNDLTYSDEALQIALDNNLTIMGTSDIHGLVDWQYEVPHGGHRPITLVFAKEKTQASIKEALMERRTVAWFHHTLIGREAYLVPLIEASISVKEAKYQGESSVITVLLDNPTHVEYTLENLSEYSFHAHTDIVTVTHAGVTKIEVKTLERKSTFDLKFRVLNGVAAPNTHPEITIRVDVE